MVRVPPHSYHLAIAFDDLDSASVVTIPRTGADDRLLARRSAHHGEPEDSAFCNSSLRICEASSRRGRVRIGASSEAVNGRNCAGKCWRSKRHNIQFITSAKSASDKGEVATPGTRMRYSRPPGTHKNLATVPARLGAVPSDPVPSSRWQPWQFKVQFCQARWGFSTPAGASGAAELAPVV